MVIFMEPRLLVNNYNENIIKLIQSSEGSERFERKLPLKKGQSIYLRNKLINKGFSNLHETRIITSITLLFYYMMMILFFLIKRF